MSRMMRKLSYDRFGGPEVLYLAEVPVPTPAKGEILVRVHAAGVNPIDWKMHKGEVKFLSGRRFPNGLGMEFAGVVDSVGPGVAGFAPGDRVFGGGRHCAADYALTKPGKIARMPENMGFDVASVLAITGVTAMNVLDKVTFAPGMKVLVNGAAGGIGMFVTQFAAQAGAEVTAVASAQNLGQLRHWGAARAVDYRQTDVLSEGLRYDVVVDMSDKLSLATAKPILNRKGLFVASLPVPSQIIGGFLNNLFSGQRYALLGRFPNTRSLMKLGDLVSSGRIKVVVGGRFDLPDFAEAHAQTLARKLPGKTVITMVRP